MKTERSDLPEHEVHRSHRNSRGSTFVMRVETSMKKNPALIAVMVLALLAGACASMRKVDVTSDPNRSYTINVHNTRAGVVSVSYSDGTVTRQLGEVGGGDTKRFVVIASPSNATITVIARTSAGATLQPQSVHLTAGTTTLVTIY